MVQKFALPVRKHGKVNGTHRISNYANAIVIETRECEISIRLAANTNINVTITTQRRKPTVMSHWISPCPLSLSTLRFRISGNVFKLFTEICGCYNILRVYEEKRLINHPLVVLFFMYEWLRYFSQIYQFPHYFSLLFETIFLSWQWTRHKKYKGFDKY